MSSGYVPFAYGVTLTAGFVFILAVEPKMIDGFGVGKEAGLIADQFVTLPIENLSVAVLSSAVKV
jgi:hypothetical protein